MSKNLTRKGLALVSGAALAVTSLVGFAAPANAAGAVTLAPTSGTNGAVFSTDPMLLTNSIQTIGGPATNTLAYKINNPDQHQLLVTFTTVTAGTIVGYTATGVEVAVGNFTSNSALIDFDDVGHNITSVVFHTLTNNAASTGISVKLDASAVDKFDDTVSGAAEVAYGELPTDAAISVQSWVEVETTADYSTVDATFASAVVPVTFIDPKNVSVISEVVRSVANGLPDTLLTAAVVAVTSNEADLTNAKFDDTVAFNGVNLATNDRVLVLGQTTIAENGIYKVTASAGLTRSVVAADNADLTSTVTSTGIVVSGGTNGSGLYSLSGDDGTNFSAVLNSTVLRTHMNGVGNKYLEANLRFSRADINLNQVDLTNWKYGVESSDNNDDLALTAISLRTTAVNWTIATHNVEAITPVGYKSTNRDAYGSIQIRGAVTGDALTSNKTYQVKFSHNTSGAATFQSTAFTTVANAVASTAVKVTSIVTSTTDATSGATPSLRAGTKAFTYRAQAENASNVDVKTANIPMVAVVKAGAFFPAGESIAVTGSTKTISKANGAVIVAGLTDADGLYSVTVTSTSAAAAQSYSVSFHIADGGNLGSFVIDAAPITGTYAAAVPTTATPTPSIASSTAVAVTVAVVDQFGTAVSTNSKGALNVELKAPNKLNLELFAAVVNGEASFAFDNYLTTGGSDVLTVRVFTGTSTSPTYVTALDTIVTMFGAVAVEAVNVAPEVTGVVVEYGDFITGKATTAKPGPSDSNKTTYTGTVVNNNGAGIAGAGITVSGAGFQFKTGTTYSEDSVTLTTDAAGSFSVEMWTTVASATGNKLTVTSGGKTASTLVKSATPTTISPANLAFSWDIPAALVMNTTYAVTATVTDKYGNGIAGAEVLFSGFGSAQFNGLASTTRDTAANGQATAFLRSLKDVDGVSAVGVTLNDLGTTTASPALTTVLTDVTTTAYDESKWSRTIDSSVNFLKTAPAASSGQKVNAGSFKGYVALYALGYEGQRMSAKVGNDWVIVPAIPAATNDLFRAVEFVGAGVEISVRLYIDRVLVATIPLLTK
jgi:hypothetical protein